ncbi:hypothetical protein D3P07_01030 [Paenibacillus sp. 1011MAR3C5]|uniref:hypothetical protein n=1 Tax=Paenibacillus sp. 1011MAR3C5 TaxID=1675787 RepID=UPI000E6CBEFE|nr:hypothetical protein [Paenibacillus sp. 1011MAR3C5]RJE90719.1 hypothetical protein D3P07_01030 [Paenibacillus sp. 1011MAR3C5]
MIKQLQERKTALQSVKNRLNGKASLKSEDGHKYLRCLAMLVSTEMQIEELQDKAKRPLCESDR